jgi:uncharacterized protein YerC
MRRYGFLEKESVYDALNKLRAAFLAARNGTEVNEIIMGILTHDERMKIGRRIQISQMLEAGLSYLEIRDNLKVGLATIGQVDKLSDSHPECYKLIGKREQKVEEVFKRRGFEMSGNPKAVFKTRIRTKFTRKEVPR